jgi:NAD(P)H-nitrite reductase large subunit
LTGVDIIAIDGDAKVESLTFALDGRRRTIPCDAVVFSGDWVPEATLARQHSIGVDKATLGPRVDGALRTVDPCIYAAGNVLRSVRSSGACALEGRLVARTIASDLSCRAQGKVVRHEAS